MPSGGTPCVNAYFASSTLMWAATFKVNTGIMRLSILSYMLENKAQNMTLLVALALLVNWEAQSFGSARVTHSSSFSSQNATSSLSSFSDISHRISLLEFMIRVMVLIPVLVLTSVMVLARAMV